MKKWLLTLAVLMGLFLPLLFCTGKSYASNKLYSLDECIKMALDFSPEVKEAAYEEEVFRAKQLQADSYIYPQVEVLAIAGPAPEAKREDFLRTDVSSPNINGVFGSLDVLLTQPIYTFGKIGSYRDAASKGLKAASAVTQRKKSDIVLRTKELYYSLLFARDLKNLVLEIKEQLVKSIEKTENQLKIGAPWADETNIYKFRAFLGEAEKNLNEVDKNLVFIKDALMASMGLSGAKSFETADSSISPEENKPESLTLYLKNAGDLRAEFTQLREGLGAKKALADAERGGYYPQIFLGVKASLAGATNRDKIKNPYVSDYFNHSYGAAFLGLKWSVDFGITKGRVGEAEAEYNKVLAKKRFAEVAIPLQIKKAYLDFEEASKNIPELEKAYINAKKWLVSSIANYDLGIGDANDIGEAAAAYALTRTNYLKSILSHRMSYANLLYASGTDSVQKY
jgi:outer membrane protein TolC